jgi:hypothetical protein
MMIVIVAVIMVLALAAGNLYVERGKPKDPTPLLGVVLPKEKKK